MMTSHLRHAAVMLILLGSIATSAAQSAPPAPLTPPVRPAAVELTPEQRSTIHGAVTKAQRKPLEPGTQVSVGAELPASVELYTFPDDVSASIPETREFKYAVWNGQVVMVDPTSMKVVELIER